MGGPSKMTRAPMIVKGSCLQCQECENPEAYAGPCGLRRYAEIRSGVIFSRRPIPWRMLNKVRISGLPRREVSQGGLAPAEPVPFHVVTVGGCCGRSIWHDAETTTHVRARKRSYEGCWSHAPPL